MNAVIYARYSSDSQREESIEGHWVCSGDGLSSILITEFFIGRCWDKVNCMEFHIPIASGSEGNRLSNTR